jgi:hypothetical protein
MGNFLFLASLRGESCCKFEVQGLRFKVRALRPLVSRTVVPLGWNKTPARN